MKVVSGRFDAAGGDLSFAQSIATIHLTGFISLGYRFMWLINLAAPVSALAGEIFASGVPRYALDIVLMIFLLLKRLSS